MPATDPSLPPLLGALWLSTRRRPPSAADASAIEGSSELTSYYSTTSAWTGQGDIFLEADASTTRAPSEVHGTQPANLAMAVAPCSWQPQPEARPARDVAQLPSVPSSAQLCAYSTEHFRGPVRRSCDVGGTRCVLVPAEAQSKQPLHWMDPPSCTIFRTYSSDVQQPHTGTQDALLSGCCTRMYIHARGRWASAFLFSI